MTTQTAHPDAPPEAPPGTTPDAASAGPEVVFYDGHCGLCHRSVKFAVRRDRDGSRFRYAPLQGDHIKTVLDERQRADLPDSIVVVTHDGRLLIKSDAWLHVMARLGGVWAGLAGVSRIVPRALRDAVYDGIAAVRYRLFKKPDEACPMMPPELRGRFLY